MKIISTSEEQTLKLGRQMGRSFKGNEVICLVGELGAGKTTLVKGIAQGMEILDGYQVRSPTFTLVNEYPTKRGKLIHVDLYRVKDFDITEFIGQGVLLIEWPTDLSCCDVIIRIEFLPEGRLIILEHAESLQLTDKTHIW